jgi:hypothetical protein
MREDHHVEPSKSLDSTIRHLGVILRMRLVMWRAIKLMRTGKTTEAVKALEDELMASAKEVE